MIQKKYQEKDFIKQKIEKFILFAIISLHQFYNMKFPKYPCFSYNNYVESCKKFEDANSNDILAGVRVTGSKHYFVTSNILVVLYFETDVHYRTFICVYRRKTFCVQRSKPQFCTLDICKHHNLDLDFLAVIYHDYMYHPYCELDYRDGNEDDDDDDGCEYVAISQTECANAHNYILDHLNFYRVYKNLRYKPYIKWTYVIKNIMRKYITNYLLD